MINKLWTDNVDMGIKTLESDRLFITKNRLIVAYNRLMMATEQVLQEIKMENQVLDCTRRWNRNITHHPNENIDPILEDQCYEKIGKEFSLTLEDLVFLEKEGLQNTVYIKRHFGNSTIERGLNRQYNGTQGKWRNPTL